MAKTAFLALASKSSVLQARPFKESTLPSTPSSASKRPVRTDAVARRLIAGALGVRLAKKTPEQLELEQQKVQQVLQERRGEVSKKEGASSS
ncbi:UNVERIFIED_CONTAM: hypothetical protein HDU68_003533 [Siphonaria sp. JEL0065]|nr:hypothetical protein HDU68_003533 [Siphonaria sp. JEL0065]